MLGLGLGQADSTVETIGFGEPKIDLRPMIPKLEF